MRISAFRPLPVSQQPPEHLGPLRVPLALAVFMLFNRRMLIEETRSIRARLGRPRLSIHFAADVCVNRLLSPGGQRSGV